MSSNVLTDRDINAAAAQQPVDAKAKADVKSMEYHRQVLQSKLEESQYVANTSVNSLHTLVRTQLDQQSQYDGVDDRSKTDVTSAEANKHISPPLTPSCPLAPQS